MSPSVRLELGNKMVKHQIIHDPEMYFDWLNEKMTQEQEQILLAKLFVAEEFPDLW